jgi:adenosine deaminase
MSRFDTMPKVELHLHLEGAIPLDALWTLVEERGGDPGVPSPEALAARFAYRDFAHFIETWVWKNRYLDSYRAFEFIAEAAARDLARQHIVYAEAFFSPTDFAQHGLSPQDLATAIRRGLDRVPQIRVALIADLVRDTGPERARRTLDRVAEVATEAGVIGIGIGGSEAEFPPGPFAPVYRAAAAAGFRLTAHAGEAAGPESVWSALRDLGVERVGHGVRAVEDPALLAHLVERRIPLEVCPTSNLRTGVVAGWDGHPARALISAGALVTLNSDDPAMFGCSLAGEFDTAAHHLGCDDATLERMAHNAVAASWAPPELKRDLAADLADWWAAAG